MRRTWRALLIVLASMGCAATAQGQSAKTYQVGVVHAGGPYYHSVEGLRDGLKELRLHEGKDYTLHVLDTKGEIKAAETAGKNLEQEKVDVIFSATTSVSLATRRGTTKIPIVFYAGSDPVESGLVKSFARPGGRATGVYSLSSDLVGKRLEILKETLPKLRTVMTLYNPDNPVAGESVASARKAAQKLGINLVERQVRSSDELQAALRALKPTDADALFLVSDATTQSRARSIIEAANARKLPTVFYDRSLVVEGGLLSYGVSNYQMGRLAAKYVQRILAGAKPADLPIERSDRFELVVNTRTAREIGITIPRVVLGRADEVIE